ncbi:MAG: hypothetical protein GWQ08_16405, partial [Verrucomicrobiaceae bacterium]|nr:hypothetical protein [Verrucomicrobiaceae bacterium]
NVENGWQNRLVTVDGEGNRRVEKWLWDGGGKLGRQWREDDDAFNPTTRPWYQGAVKQIEEGGEMGALMWTPPYVFYSTREPGITVARMAAQSDGGKSVVSLDVHLTEMTSYIRSLSISPNGYAFVVAEDGKLVGLPQHGDEDEANLAKTFARDPASQGMDATASLLSHAGGVPLRPVDSFRYKLGGEWYWGCVRPIEVPGVPRFYFGVVVPELDFLTESHRHHLLIFMLSVVMLLVATGVAVILAKHYSRPLSALAESHERLRRLDTSEAPHVDTRLRELAQLEDAHGRTCAALDSFARYVPRDLVRELMERGEAAKIGSRRAELTLVFMDIQGFTALSERLGPERTVERLSSYFEMVIGCLREHGGTIDKLIGDAVFAFWGAPEDQPDRCQRALVAVLECHHCLEDFNKDLIAQGQSPLPTRFGVATGKVMVGNIGSPSRINYTALGHKVNLASRLEGLNSHYGTSILVDGQTHRCCEDVFRWRHLDTVRVKGSKTPEPIYELLGTNDARDSEERDWVECYEKALNLYRAKEFDQALAVIEALLETTPSDISMQRLSALCKECRVHLPDDWDGVTRFYQK